MQRHVLTCNAQSRPMSKHATDPDKVSHHIHRIGYHFRSDIVDEAREQLDYVYYRGKFVKESVMQAQRSKARLRNTLAQYGITMHDNDGRETAEQVSAFIKELFPNIPQYDLDWIVENAWQAGSQRVGTNETMSLASRVQFAVIARIRHVYTDYDRLLKAFDWKQARFEVEPECVLKVKEWRGEQGNDDEEKGFEDTIQDVIVIPDDDEEMDEDEDDVSVGELDYESDSSVEIVEHRMVDDDFAAENPIWPGRVSRPSTKLTLRQFSDQDDAYEAQQARDRAMRARQDRRETSLYGYPPYATFDPQPRPQPKCTGPPIVQPVVVSVESDNARAEEQDMELGGYIFRSVCTFPTRMGRPQLTYLLEPTAGGARRKATIRAARWIWRRRSAPPACHVHARPVLGGYPSGRVRPSHPLHRTR